MCVYGHGTTALTESGVGVVPDVNAVPSRVEAEHLEVETVSEERFSFSSS